MIKLLQSTWSCPNNDKFTPGWIRVNVSDTQTPTCQCRTCLFLTLSNAHLVFEWAHSLMEQFVPDSLLELHLPAEVVWILRFWFRQVSSWASLYGEQESYELVPIGTAFLRRWWWYHIWKSQCCKRGRWEYPKGIDAILNYMSAVDETSPEVPISQQWSKTREPWSLAESAGLTFRWPKLN